MNLEQGKKLIRLARNSISSYFSNKEVREDDASEDIKKEFNEERGVFVTLNKGGELRGCIGYPEPVYPLWKAVLSAARSAAFRDPRFPPISKEEYESGDITVEISVLTVPELIKVNDSAEYLNKIKIGEDGLIIRGSGGSGLLLPQVAVEWKWNVLEFLENTCKKAGMDSGCWKDTENEIYKFQAKIFSEKDGKVVEL